LELGVVIYLQPLLITSSGSSNNNIDENNSGWEVEFKLVAWPVQANVVEV
jgi:hypothetical protein